MRDRNVTPELALDAHQLYLLRLIGEEGACNQEPVKTGEHEPWFPEKGQRTRPAKEVCWKLCPVREQCLEYALSAKERFGVYGGFSSTERRRLTRRSA